MSPFRGRGKRGSFVQMMRGEEEHLLGKIE